MQLTEDMPRIRHVKLEGMDEKLIRATMTDEERKDPEKILRRFERDILPVEDALIPKWFQDKSVLITGATGFFGKVLLEKLLRTCHGLKVVYVLIRSKKGKDMNARLEDLFEDVIFSRLRVEHPKFRHKVVAFSADVGLPELGLSKHDRSVITDNVSIIFHGAATVRFDEKLNLAVAINVRGVKEILDIARECKNLESFVHVSSAFANCPQKFIEEKFYPPPMNSEKIIDLADSLTDKNIEEITAKILGPWPNTYAFTKAIAEDTVREYGRGLPICIMRPSIVIATYNEPIRGWIDNVYGPTGVLVGVGTGVIRSMYCNKETSADVVPVDMVVNCMITAAWKTGVKKIKSMPIYNYVSGVENEITWDNFMKINMRYGMRVPTIKAIWYYNFRLTRYKLLHTLFALFLHYLPAILVDGVAIALGRKPVLLKVYKKIAKFGNVMAYFAVGCWKFDNEHVSQLWKELPQADKDNFFFDMKQLDWEDHSRTHIAGVRVYLVKDDLQSLPEARVRWNRLRILNNCVVLLFFVLMLRLAWWVLGGESLGLGALVWK